MYYDLAWYLYGELWAVSLVNRAELSVKARRVYLDQLLKPVLDPATPEAIKSALLIRLFQVVLAARMWPLLDPSTGPA